MPATDTRTEVRVEIAPDKSSAELILPEGVTRGTITAQTAQTAAANAKLQITDQVSRAIDEVLAQRPDDDGAPWRGVVARGVSPRDGVDGEVVWNVGTVAENEDDDSDRVDQYKRSSFILIKKDQIIGEVRPPVEGQAGCDVYGTPIPPRAAAPARIQLEKSIAQDDAGKLIAQIDGVLSREQDKALIRPILEIPQHVDFSTGNIDFDGDVTVRGGVRDNFVVKATKNVEVRGLIEAATIQCAGDLAVMGGMAGRQKGKIAVGGTVSGKYLDQVEGELGTLAILREVVGCNLVVHGDVNMPSGAIIGGEIIVTGSVEVGSLGSHADVPTSIVLGQVPIMEEKVGQLEKLAAQLKARRGAPARAMGELEAKGKMASAEEKEKITEHAYAIAAIDDKVQQITKARDQLVARIEEQRKVDLKVTKHIYPETRLIIREYVYRFVEELKGPVRIGCDLGGRGVYRAAGASESTLLAQVAETHSRMT